MKEKRVILKNEKVGLIICCIFCFLAHLAVVNQFNGWFCTDTDGYWLHAATFTGHDWSGVASKVSMFYAWGYSIVLIIPFLLSSDILVMSKIAVIINAGFCALTIPFLYSIGKKLFAEVNKWMIMTAALITSLYSSYFLGSSVALAEAFIYFLYVLLIWLVLQYLESEKWYFAVFSSLCCGYLYITHHRNLGMVVAFAIFAVVQFLKNKNWKEMLCLILPLILMFGLDNTVNDWLNVKEMEGAVYTANTYGSVGGQVFNIFTVKGMIMMLQNVLGELWYLLAGTFVIAGVGIVFLIRTMIEQDEKTEVIEILFHKKFIYGIYLFLNILMMIGVSATFCLRSTNVQYRIDCIFYGRYFEATICIILFAGLIALSKLKKEEQLQKDVRMIFLLTICLSVFVHFFTEEITGNAINYFSVSAVLFPFSHPNLSFSVVNSSICLLLLGILFIILFLQKEFFYQILGYLLIGGCFLYVGYNATINVREFYVERAAIANYPVYNEEFVVMSNCIQGLDLDSLYIFAEDGTEYDAFSYQLFHPDRKIITIKSSEEIKNCESEYIILPINLIEEWNVEKVLMETPNYILCRFIPEKNE